MKKVILWLLALLLCAAPAVLADSSDAMYYDEETGGLVSSKEQYISYTLLDDGTARVDSVYADTYPDGLLRIPASVEGHAVTAINGEELLANTNKTIKKVIIPPSVKEIVNDEDSGLGETLVISEHIRELVFEGDNSSFSVEDDLVYLNDSLVGCLASSNRQSVQIRPGTVKVYLSAFTGSSNLREIVIPSTVTEIFYEPWKAALHEIPGLLERFTVEEGNPVLFSSQGILYSREEAICCPPQIPDREIIVPEGIRVIRPRAFSVYGKQDDAPFSVRLPQSLEAIQEEAFYCCYDLSSINIPAGVKEIGDGAFVSCYYLDFIKVDPANPRYRTEGPFLIEADTDTLMAAYGTDASFTVPEGIRAIGAYAFSHAAVFGQVQLPSTLEYIGVGSFIRAEIREIVIPSAVTKIDDAAFESCPALKTVRFENNKSALTSIGAGAFSFAEALTSVEMPEDMPLLTIGANAFEFCSDLKRISLPDTMTRLGEYAFWCCTQLREIHMPASLTEIGEHAFQNCINLRYLEIPAGVGQLNVNVFGLCSSLKHVFFYGNTKVRGFDTVKAKFIITDKMKSRWDSFLDIDYQYLSDYVFRQGPMQVVSSTDAQVQKLLDEGGSMQYHYQETFVTDYVIYKGKASPYQKVDTKTLVVTMQTADGQSVVREYPSEITETQLFMGDNYLEYEIVDYRTVIVRSQTWEMVLKGASLV